MSDWEQTRDRLNTWSLGIGKVRTGDLAADIRSALERDGLLVAQLQQCQAALKVATEMFQQGREQEKVLRERVAELERARQKVEVAFKAMHERCSLCGGDGWTAETEHNPACTGEKCVEPCPVQVQVTCPRCAGSGRQEGVSDGTLRRVR